MQRSLFTLLAVFCIYMPLQAAEPSQQHLKNQLIAMSEALDTNETEAIRTFMLTYAIPKSRQPYIPDAMIDEIVSNFMTEKQAGLKQALSVVQEMTPQVEDDNRTYTFLPENDPSGELTKPLTFVFDDNATFLLQR